MQKKTFSTPAPAPASQRRSCQLCAPLGRLGWISAGSVQARVPGTGRASYPWTRKVNGKTGCVALSQEQYEWLKTAIANERRAQATLREMQRLSRAERFATIPGQARRKRLSKKFLSLK